MSEKKLSDSRKFWYGGGKWFSVRVKEENGEEMNVEKWVLFFGSERKREKEEEEEEDGSDRFRFRFRFVSSFVAEWRKLSLSIYGYEPTHR